MRAPLNGVLYTVTVLEEAQDVARRGSPEDELARVGRLGHNVRAATLGPHARRHVAEGGSQKHI